MIQGSQCTHMRAFDTVIKASLALDTNVQEQIYRYMYKEIKLHFISNQCALDVSIFFPKTRSVIPKFVNGKNFKKI